jgi:ADP-heptose:LPS heptosyltransferase/GT2 family glycosyltransferase/Flp pilus assembly protein TadD/ubiquinone/menaquinone biosynthesis C-methylase UbiE
LLPNSIRKNFLSEDQIKLVKKIKVAEEYSSEIDLTEISFDSEFSIAIKKIFKEVKPKRIIETGTYHGDGTTKVIASAIRELDLSDTLFYSIEINPDNHQKAKINLENNNLLDYVVLLNGLSVPTKLLPTKEEIGRRTVESIEFDDIFIDHKESVRVEKYFNETNFPDLQEDLIGFCLAKFEHKPDFILLDSGGHMGFIEFNYVIDKVKSNCIIALDDVFHIKHHKSYLFMKNDPRFEIINESKEKFGFCIAKFVPNNKTNSKLVGYSKEKVNCLLCNAKLSYPVREGDIVKCLSCGFVYLKERFTASEMERYYKDVYAVNDPFAASPVRVPKSKDEVDNSFDYKGALREELFNEAVKVYNKKIKNGLFIDIGCGWGGLLYTAKKNLMNVIGFEFTQPNVDFAKNVLGLEVRQQQFDKSDLPANSADIITMSHVLGHVPNPLGVIKKIFETLKFGGIFYCVIPNFNSFCSSIEKEEWLWLDKEWHYSHFTPDVIKNALEQAGFTFEKFSTESGDYDITVPIGILKKMDSSLNSDDKLFKALMDINESGRGEEIRIIARKQHSKKIIPNKKNLVWIRTDSIGDAILSLNMLEHFAQNLNNYKVTVVCQEHIKEVYSVLPFIDEIIVFNRKKIIDNNQYRAELIERLKKQNIDLLINSVYSKDVISEFLMKEIPAHAKIGFKGDTSNLSKVELENSWKIYDHLVQVTDELNEFDKNIAFLKSYSIEVNDYQARFPLTKEEISFADNFFSRNELIPEKTIAFFAGAQYNIRYYYNYGKALEQALKGEDYSIVTLGGKNDEYINDLNLKDFSGRIVDMTGKTSFRESAAILSKCILAVGSETSLAHAACALNIPNVIILGGGHFGRFMPYSNLTTIVALPLNCFNCNWKCKYDEVYCIKKIDSNILATAIKEVLFKCNQAKNAYFQKGYELDWLENQPGVLDSSKVYKGNSNYQEIKIQPSHYEPVNFKEIEKNNFLNKRQLILLKQLNGLIHTNDKHLDKYKRIEDEFLSFKNINALMLKSGLEKSYIYSYLQGLVEYNNNNFIEAIKILKEVVNTSQKNFRVASLLGELFFKTKDHINVSRIYSYLFENNVKLDSHEKRKFKASKVVNETQILNQLSSATYYDVSPVPGNCTGRSLGFSQEKISIIVPSKSRSSQLFEMLDSIIYAAYNMNFEVILYLNNEVEITQDEIAKYHISKIFYDNEIFPNGGFCWTKLMNHGFANASGDWVMYGSDDIVFHPLAFNFALMENHSAEVGGITFIHRDTVEDYSGFYKNYGFDTYGMKPYINFGIIRKTAFLQTDGFYEGILFYSGDVDICWQIVSKGFKIIPSYHSLVEHNNVTDKIRSEKSDKIFLDDTRSFIFKWADEISNLPFKRIIKERFILHDIYPFKNEIYKECILQSIPFDKLAAIDKDYIEIDRIEKNRGKENTSIKVSAIVSVFNSGKFINGCLEDLVSQTLFDKGMLEIVIVNCGDDKVDEREIQKYKSKYKNIVYIKNDVKIGIYKAWNIGIKAASGNFITNANTDDRHKRDAFEKMLAVFDKYEDIDLVYADVYRTEKINDVFNSITPKSLIKWMDFDKDLLLFGCYMGPQPMWKKSLHDKYGYFNENLEVVGDYEFWLRVSQESIFYHLNEILGLYYFSPNSAEHRNKLLTDRENIAVQRKYISKYINSFGKIDAIYKKISKITSNDSENSYYKFVSRLLEERKKAITIENKFLDGISQGLLGNLVDIEGLIPLLISMAKFQDISIDGENIFVFYKLLDALVYLRNNDKAKAISILQRAYKIYPLKFVADFLGLTWEEKQDEYPNYIDEFISEITKLIEIKDYQTGINKIVEFLSELDKMNKGISNPNKELLYTLLGKLYMLEGDYEKANIFYEKELQLNPTSSRACAGLGDVFFVTGLYNEAKTMFEWALRYKPVDNSLFNKLVEVNNILKLESFNYSLYEKVDDSSAIKESENLIKEGCLIEAEKVLVEILSNQPSQLDALNNYAVVQILRENLEEALAALERIFTIEPNNEIAVDNLNYLNSLINSKA